MPFLGLLEAETQVSASRQVQHIIPLSITQVSDNVQPTVVQNGVGRVEV